MQRHILRGNIKAVKHSKLISAYNNNNSMTNSFCFRSLWVFNSSMKTYLMRVSKIMEVFHKYVPTQTGTGTLTLPNGNSLDFDNHQIPYLESINSLLPVVVEQQHSVGITINKPRRPGTSHRGLAC